MVPWPEDADPPKEVAQRVIYEGSALHKAHPSPAGPPALRADKAKCDPFAENDWPQLSRALQDGILAGAVGAFRGGFPERVWVWINDVLHEARLTNEAAGVYHGFPINDSRQYPEPADRLEAIPRVTIPAV